MNKKSLLILLILPFIVAISFFAASNILFTRIEGDLVNIAWAYRNFEAYSINGGKIRLEAKAVLPDDQGEINTTLLWNVENLDSTEEEHARLESSDFGAYLIPLSEGDVKITCRNKKGTISKSFNARLYDKGTVVVNTKRLRSHDSISGKDYYGQYDFTSSGHKEASFYIDVESYPVDLASALVVTSTPNISYNEKTGLVTLNSPGEATLKFDVPHQEGFKETIYTFNIVKDGYNVYSYDDLMKCTNNDEEGKIVCLQTNLESLDNTFVDYKNGDFTKKDEVTELFGNYDAKKQKFNFENEVNYVESTYNTEFIKQANEKRNANLSSKVVVGVNIKKDFYGNGYKINAHNLTYPSSKIQTENGTVAALSPTDLFRGPLPFVIVGEIKTPIIKSFGQDNIGFYVNGDNIKLNDVYFKNCDFSDILENNNTTGTVLEINGDNVEVRNSHLSSGRTVLRSYSNMNVNVINSVIEKSREFNAKVGCNEYEKVTQMSNFDYVENGVTKTATRKEFLNSDDSSTGNLKSYSSQLLTTYADSTSIASATEKYQAIQNSLNQKSLILKNGEPNYKNQITFKDTYFHQSGLFSIGIDTLFNGPYLYNGAPINGMGYFDQYLYPDNIAGVNYPTLVNVEGDTRFYDYKNPDVFNLDCLIDEDISNQLDREVSIDQFFPIKTMMVDYARSKNCLQHKDDKTYLNAPIVYYGGGLCLSEVNCDKLNSRSNLIDNISLDYFSYVLQQPSKGLFVDMLGRCVSMAIGFEPFKVMLYDQTGYLFNQELSIENLKARA